MSLLLTLGAPAVNIYGVTNKYLFSSVAKVYVGTWAFQKAEDQGTEMLLRDPSADSEFFPPGKDVTSLVLRVFFNVLLFMLLQLFQLLPPLPSSTQPVPTSIVNPLSIVLVHGSFTYAP